MSLPTALTDAEMDAIVRGEPADPFVLLGMHPLGGPGGGPVEIEPGVGYRLNTILAPEH